jgi:hypothetical protein
VEQLTQVTTNLVPGRYPNTRARLRWGETVMVTVTTASVVTTASAVTASAVTASAVTASAASAVTASAASAASAASVAHVSSVSAPSRSCAYVIVSRCRAPGRFHHGLDPAMALANS